MGIVLVGTREVNSADWCWRCWRGASLPFRIIELSWHCDDLPRCATNRELPRLGMTGAIARRDARSHAQGLFTAANAEGADGPSRKVPPLFVPLLRPVESELTLRMAF